MAIASLSLHDHKLFLRNGSKKTGQVGSLLNDAQSLTDCGELDNVWPEYWCRQLTRPAMGLLVCHSSLLRPQIVASHHPTVAVAQDNHSVRVLRHQRIVEPASNLQPLRAGRCLRGTHH